MTMKTKLLICLAALLGVAAHERATQEIKMPRSRFNVRVLDEAGAPMPDALVQVVFMDPITRQDAPQQGITGADGLFALEGYTDGTLGGGVTKPGFYRSGWGGPKFMRVEKGRWQPWDETYTTHLRPVINPVPMTAKVVQATLPELNKPCGYDLSVGDWVAPNGKGKHADFVFTGRNRYVSRHDFEAQVEMAFSQPLDGLIQIELPAIGRYSFFKWPRLALEKGYTSPVPLHVIGDRESVRHSFEASDTFFFRVRTVEQNGQIVAANYGRLTGLQVDSLDARTCYVTFTYYLNPTSLDRNMEADPKRNLLSGLSRMETPQFP